MAQWIIDYDFCILLGGLGFVSQVHLSQLYKFLFLTIDEEKNLYSRAFHKVFSVKRAKQYLGAVIN